MNRKIMKREKLIEIALSLAAVNTSSIDFA